MRASAPAVVVGILLATAAAKAAEPSAHAMLDRMNEAVRTLDYEGRFVVQAGDRLDAMYIVHRVDGGSEKERVVSLTGEPREIIRSDEAVACLVPGREQHINVGRPAQGRSFSPLNGVSTEQLEAHYRMQVLEPGRVAGRDADQVLVEPLDDLRFGYRLFIDQASGLPLRTVMFDAAARVVSQTMFVEIKTEGTITPIERDLSAMQQARAVPSETPAQARLAPPGWTFGAVPPGFRLAVHRRRALAGGQGEMEHFVFSDGLASVSVYIQPTDGKDALTGESSMGAASAVGRLLDQYEVVAVGEVPLKTLHWFAQHVEAAGK